MSTRLKQKLHSEAFHLIGCIRVYKGILSMETQEEVIQYLQAVIKEMLAEYDELMLRLNRPDLVHDDELLEMDELNLN